MLPLQGDMGSIPGQGTKILHALWCGQEKEVKHTKYKQIAPPTSLSSVRDDWSFNFFLHDKL